MTVVVGLVDREAGRCYVGADSQGTDSLGTYSTRLDSKVFRVGEFVIGFSGSYRYGQILQFHLDPPKIGQIDLYQYLVKYFVEEMRAVLKDKGAVKIDSGIESTWACLVSVRGELFGIHSDLAVCEYSEDFAAMGAGEKYAIGAMNAQKINGMLIGDASLRVALSATERSCTSVKGPWSILSTSRLENR